MKSIGSGVVTDRLKAHPSKRGFFDANHSRVLGAPLTPGLDQPSARSHRHGLGRLNCYLGSGYGFHRLIALREPQ